MVRFAKISPSRDAGVQGFLIGNQTDRCENCRCRELRKIRMRCSANGESNQVGDNTQSRQDGVQQNVGLARQWVAFVGWPCRNEGALVAWIAYEADSWMSVVGYHIAEGCVPSWLLVERAVRDVRHGSSNAMRTLRRYGLYYSTRSINTEHGLSRTDITDI